jgi:hypothetical protein
MLQMNLQYPESEEYWNSIFHDSVLTPQSWVDAAADLAKALIYLRPPVIEFCKAAISSDAQRLPVEKGVHGSYLMIAAYALENMFKAMLTSKATETESPTPQALLKELKTHDLSKLAAAAGVILTEQGSDLLARLTYFAVWAGRYPAPLATAALKPQSVSGGAPNTLRCLRGSDVRSIDELLLYCSAALGIPPIFAIDAKGYGDSPERWEGVVMAIGVRPW